MANKTIKADKQFQLPEPAGFSAGSHDGALFTTKRETGKNFAIGAKQPLCEWYSAEQMRDAFAAGCMHACRRS
ncbi:MAG: hypothetical protein BWZ07_03095 [Alphaproteobacteria bacterium ADurb.BinA280]|nr:MAG: hypothetical protein BWZ07_03095 [Alphaproteobacteria bacterium ADurb.BinA280]